MIVREDGEYDSPSDYDEDTPALISAQQEDNEDSEHDIEVMGAEDVDNYRSLHAWSCEGPCYTNHHRWWKLQ